MAERRVRDEPMASIGSSIAPCHLGVEARFVEKHPAARINLRSPVAPSLTLLLNVFALLFCRVLDFF